MEESMFVTLKNRRICHNPSKIKLLSTLKVTKNSRKNEKKMKNVRISRHSLWITSGFATSTVYYNAIIFHKVHEKGRILPFFNIFALVLFTKCHFLRSVGSLAKKNLFLRYARTKM